MVQHIILALCEYSVFLQYGSRWHFLHQTCKLPIFYMWCLISPYGCEQWQETLETGMKQFKCKILHWFTLMSKKWWEPVFISPGCYSQMFFDIHEQLSGVGVSDLTFIFLPWPFLKCLLAYGLNNMCETGCSAMSGNLASLKKAVIMSA